LFSLLLTVWVDIWEPVASQLFKSLEVNLLLETDRR
jgi:hypothetical protein